MVEGGLEKALKDEQPNQAVEAELVRISKLGNKVPEQHQETVRLYREMLLAGDAVDPDSSNLLSEIEQGLDEAEHRSEEQITLVENDQIEAREAEEVYAAVEEPANEVVPEKISENIEKVPPLQEMAVTVEGQSEMVRNVENYRGELTALLLDKVPVPTDREERLVGIKKAIKKMYREIERLDSIKLDERRVDSVQALRVGRYYTQAINLMHFQIESLKEVETARPSTGGTAPENIPVLEKEAERDVSPEPVREPKAKSATRLEQMQAEMDNAKGGDVELDPDALESPPGSDFDLEDDPEVKKLIDQIQIKKTGAQVKNNNSESPHTSESKEVKTDSSEISETEWKQVQAAVADIKKNITYKLDGQSIGEIVAKLYSAEDPEVLYGQGDKPKAYETTKNRIMLAIYEGVKKGGRVNEETSSNPDQDKKRIASGVYGQYVHNPFDRYVGARRAIAELHKKKKDTGERYEQKDMDALHEAREKAEVELLQATRLAIASAILDKKKPKAERNDSEKNETEKIEDAETLKKGDRKSSPVNVAAKKTKKSGQSKKSNSKKESAVNDPFAALDAVLDDE